MILSQELFPTTLGVFLALVCGALAAASVLAFGWPASESSGTRCRLAGSWIAGLCVLYTAAFLCQILGIPIRLPTVAIVASVLSASLWLFGRRRQPVFSLSQGHREPALGILPSVLGGLAVLVFAARSFLQPLQGADAIFRWEFLARLMLLEGNLDFYPPRTAEDFEIYFYPDGMSPLVALSHWWAYAIRGIPDLSATYAVVSCSYIVCLVLVVRVAAHFAGASAASGALYAALGSPILFWAFLQGQETGLASIGIVGGVYFLWVEKPTRGSALMAGLSLALASLAREYGPGLAAAVIVGALFARLEVRWGALLLSLVTVGGGWYTRNLVLSGNPFYGLSIAGLFPTNPVLDGLLASCKESVGWSSLGARGALKVFGHLLQLAFLPLVTGLLLCLARPTKYLWFVCPALVCLAVWAQAVNYTSGGAIYSYRVLAPLVALGAAASGIVYALIAARGKPLSLCGFLWPLVGVYGVVNSLTMPALAKSLPPVNWMHMAFAPKGYSRFLVADNYHGAKVLSDNAYLHAKAYGNACGLEVISLWSPESAFVFEEALSYEEKLRRLRDLGITHVSPHAPTSPYWSFFVHHAFFREIFAKWERDENNVPLTPDLPASGVVTFPMKGQTR